MSELLQSRLHPDADQLNAFVEQALPAHEQQQTLAHLATCSNCRAIVALSLPELDETAKPRPQPVRVPRHPGWLPDWLMGWGVAWPVGATLAATVLIGLYIHKPKASPRHGSASGNQPEISEMASSVPPLPLPSPQPAPLPTRKSEVPGSAVAKPFSPPRSGQSVASISEPAVKRPMTVLSVPLQPAAGTAIASETTGTAPAAIPPPPATLRSSKVNLGAASSVGTVHGAITPLVQSAASAGAQAQPAAQKQLSALSPPPPPLAPTPTAITGAALDALSDDAASQTITVTDAPPAYTPSTSNATLALTLKNPPASALPSGLPTLSTASGGLETLALDTRNHLFLSNDGGAHWKSVPANWKGRAVQVSAAPNPVPRTHPLADASGTGLGRASAVALAAPTPASTPAASASLAGTVTDASGAVIPAASIVIINPAAQAVRTVKSDGAGHYSVSGLAPGSYRLEAAARGFQTLRLPVTVTAAQPSIANLTLTIGASTETVTVEAARSEIALAEAAPPQTHQLAKRGGAKPASLAAPVQPPLFEIVTDTGDRWISRDGRIWKRK